VLPLWRDEVGIYLAQRRACLVRMRRGIRATLAAEADHTDPAAAAGWEGALALLEQQMNEGTWSDARVRIVLADQWVRYSVVPWSDALSSNGERLAHARELMSGIFGAEMSDWTVSLSEAPPGSPRLASALPTALLQALRDSALRHRQRLVSVQPQLIVLDIMMPGLDGLGALRMLKENPATRDIPVVVLSAKGHSLTKIDAALAGAVLFLAKPFSPNQLLGEVQKILAPKSP